MQFSLRNKNIQNTSKTIDSRKFKAPMKTLKTWRDHGPREFMMRGTHETCARTSFSLIVYIVNIRGISMPSSLPSVSLVRKEPEPLNARSEPSVVVYLHNLWGSKNAKKLISRPRHRLPPQSLHLSASSLVYIHLLHTTFVPFFTSSVSSSSFARVCPRPFRRGLLRSLGALSRLFPEVRINFYLVCGVRNLFRDAPSLSLSLFDFFLSMDVIVLLRLYNVLARGSHKSRRRLAYSSSSNTDVF